MQPIRDIDTTRREVLVASKNLLGMIDRSFLHEIQQHGLDEMVRLTASRVGFLYTVDSEVGTIGLSAVSVAGKEPQLLFRDAGTGLDRNGYWRAAMVSREAVIRNHPADLVPPRIDLLGPIERDLTVPILIDNKIVAVVGVGNPITPYEPADAEVLQEMANGLWRVVVRKQLHDGMSDDVK